MTAAAIALAAALLIAPSQPLRRLVPRAPGGRRRPRGRPIAAAGAAIAIAVAVVVPVAVLLASAIAVATLAWRRRRQALGRRHVAEVAGLQAALVVLIGELRVGAHPVAAFDVAAHETQGRTAEALRGVAARARLGADVGAGLAAVARDSTVPAQWLRLSDCWRLTHAHGLSIATLLRTAHRDAVERDRFSSTVNAGMAGARATATILAALPVLGIGLGHLIGADPLRFLMSDGPGGWVLALGVTLVCAGLLWSDRIIERAVA